MIPAFKRSKSAAVYLLAPHTSHARLRSGLFPPLHVVFQSHRYSVKPSPTSLADHTPMDHHSYAHSDFNQELFPKLTTAARKNQSPMEQSLESSLSYTDIFQRSKWDNIDIKPEVRSKHFYDFEEQMALMDVLIKSGSYVEAETIFHRCWKTNWSDMKKCASTHMFNSFLEAYIWDSPEGNLGQVQDWYQRFKAYGVSPNAHTFALLIYHHLIKHANAESAKAVIIDAEAQNYTLDDIVRTDVFLDPEHRTTVEKIAVDMGKSIQGSRPDDLLLTALDELIAKTTAARSVKSVDSILDDALDSLALASPAQPENPTKREKPDEHERPVLPELISTQSIGVQLLRKTLSNIETARKEKRDLYQIQEQIEEFSFQAASEARTLAQERLPAPIRFLNALPSKMISEWFKTLTEAIRDELDMLKPTKSFDHRAFMKHLTPEQLARITITEFIKPSHVIRSPEKSREDEHIYESAWDHRVTEIMSEIGKNVNREAKLKFKKLSSKQKQNIYKKRAEISQKVHELHQSGALLDVEGRKTLSETNVVERSVGNDWEIHWPTTSLVKIGGTLVTLFLKTAKIQTSKVDPNNPRKMVKILEPAFVHKSIVVFIDNNPVSIGKISPHEELKEILSREAPVFQPRLMPMLVPPRPWLTWKSGGYLHQSNTAVRISHFPTMQEYLRKADDNKYIDEIMRCLDILGAIPWRINNDVLKVVIDVWNSGESIGNIPPLAKPLEPAAPKDMDINPDVKKKYQAEHHKWKNVVASLHSQRCDTNYKIEIAKAYAGMSIYFPHNLDFRGRAYPIPPLLNHMGNDLCRGLLMFDEAKPLGEEGLKWLKIQIATLAGADKISFEDRIKFTESNLENIFDSFDNPLTGKRWWIGEDPFQLLAACCELTRALRSPEPTKYMSRLPIHQDGSCNGLQHYAALGGDEMGAKQVNLLPSEKPQDVYSGVADIVSRLVAEDAAKEIPEAVFMNGKVNRKLVKQTVMTNTYGVTFLGARLQVQSRMKEAGYDKILDSAQFKAVSLYITRQIFASLGVMFEGARLLQHWLNNAALVICKSVHPDSVLPMEQKIAEDIWKHWKEFELPNPQEDHGTVLSEPEATEDSLLDCALDEAATASSSQKHVASAAPSDGSELIAPTPSRKKSSKKEVLRNSPVIWTSPLGLPIVQPYRNYREKTIRTELQTVTIKDFSSDAEINSRKQSNAFPPNFIHSLDASHMMLSAIGCQTSGITFAAVHDSYWTHASTVPELARILRKSFVHLHSQDIMGRLREELTERYKANWVPYKLSISTLEQRNLLNQIIATHSGKPLRSRKAGAVYMTWRRVSFPPLPKKGNFDLGLVTKSPYFFH